MENNVAKRALASPATRVSQLVVAQDSSTENTPSCERLATIGLTALADFPDSLSLGIQWRGDGLARSRRARGRKNLTKAEHGLAAHSLKGFDQLVTSNVLLSKV